MSSNAEITRAKGCTLRVEIINAHNIYGDRIGAMVLARFLHEVASNGIEIHGRAAMVRMFQAQLYALNAGSDEPPPVTEPEPTVIDLVEAAVAPAEEPTEEPAVETIRDRSIWVPTDREMVWYLAGLLMAAFVMAVAQ